MKNKKVAIITGGAQGIGKAIAKRFLKENIDVAIVDIDHDAGMETEKEFANLGNIMFIHADISDEDDVKRLISETYNNFHRIDILINNAGVFKYRPIEELSLCEWNNVLGTNLTGAFLCAKHGLFYLKQNKGSIINICSTRAFMSEPDTYAYSASKGGLYALTHSMAVGFGPDVRVNSISPGWIEVSEWKKTENRHKPVLSEIDHKQHPSGRVGKPEDVAAMALYLVSDEASFVTGSNFNVDGGMTKKMIYAE